MISPSDAITETEVEAVKNILNRSDEKENIITESIFISELLPIVSDPTQPIDKWLHYAGHTHLFIKVVDDNTGELLFRVPPILPSGVLPMRPGFSAYEISFHTSRLREQTPAAAKEYFEQQMELAIDKGEKQKETASIKSQWKFIFDRYYKKPETPTEKNEPNDQIQWNDDIQEW